VREVTPTWTGVKPQSYDIEVSLDGRQWHAAKSAADTDDPRLARYVRVTVRGAADAKEHPGITELTVK
ncbi:hypothetical protein, partial [Streptomyces lasiicapitis]